MKKVIVLLLVLSISICFLSLSACISPEEKALRDAEAGLRAMQEAVERQEREYNNLVDSIDEINAMHDRLGLGD